MTETTKKVFEKYEIRKTKAQKLAFREYLKERADDGGYRYSEEKAAFGATNVIIGDPTSAKVIYTAHYDTCARMPVPNFITPTNFLVYLLYQLAITLLLIAVPLVLMFALGVALTLISETVAYAVMPYFGPIFSLLVLAECALIMVGPQNKHTSNDNTSGVTTLLDLMNEMPEELRSEAAFIFFDLEEAGLFGSSGYYEKHKKEVSDKLLINFDCVSDGKTMLFALKKKAAAYADKLETAYPKNETFDVLVMSLGVFYPSDQASYPLGVGVAALKKTRGGLLYMDRIHTKKDTEYQEENIKFLVDGSVRLTRALSEEASK